MTKINAVSSGQVPPRTESAYPSPFASQIKGREKRALGTLFGLTQFGVNVTTLQPGGVSALRHWHEKEDEFIFIVSGELVLVDESGEQLLTMGMCAGFKAGVANGHCLINRSDKPALYLEVGTRLESELVHYPGVDLQAVKEPGSAYKFQHRDGTPY